jgi:dephospho-CoA kinase
MITFGLTGGIGSGKSTVTKTFIKHGIPMVDADLVARQVVEPGTIGLSQLVAAFSFGILQTDGSLDRAKLAEMVFSNESNVHRDLCMKRLNSIMAPLIHDESMRQIDNLHKYGHEIVGYDAALIIEQGNANKFRPLILVACPKEMQVERIMKRNSVTKEQALARINAQLSVEEKTAVADIVVDTSGTVEYSIQQTESIIKSLRSK